MEDKKFPQRKQIRIKEYDYSQEGYYFITICTKDRKQILSKIINEEKTKSVGVAPQGDPKKENMKIELLYEGKIVKKYIENYNKNFECIKINDYIIMPNHIHFIIELINENGSPKAATPTIPKIINAFKSIISKEIGYSIWQRNYYEHVIRNEKEYYKILEYIEINPLKWEEDIYYKEGNL